MIAGMLSQSSILNVFGRSPIKPLQLHMEQANLCAGHLLDFVQASIANNWELAEKWQQTICQHEHEADTLKMDLRLHLPKSLFLPFSRTDFLDLLAKQELIANQAKDIAGLMLGRQMQIPAELVDLFLDYLKRTIDASKQAKKAISELDELLETGFKGKEVSIVEDMIEKTASIEHDTDEIQIKLRRQLYQLEKTLPPIDVMFLYKVIDAIGDLADHAEKVSTRLQMLLVN